MYISERDIITKQLNDRWIWKCYLLHSVTQLNNSCQVCTGWAKRLHLTTARLVKTERAFKSACNDTLLAVT